MAAPSFYLKAALFVLLTLLLGPAYLILLAAAYPLRLRLGPALVRVYSRICLRIFRVSVVRVGNLRRFRQIRGRILVVANHVSFLDIFLLSAVFGTAFVSKAEVRGYPVIGPIAGLMGCVFFDRGSHSERHRLIRTLATGKAARVMAVFPQGTTGRSTGMLPFHRGIFKVVELNPEITILPVTIKYREEDAIAWVRPQSLRDNAVRVCGLGRIRAEVMVHRPLTIGDYRGGTAAEVCRRAQDAVMAPLLEER